MDLINFISTTIIILSIFFLIFSGYKFGCWIKHKLLKLDS